MNSLSAPLPVVVPRSSPGSAVIAAPPPVLRIVIALPANEALPVKGRRSPRLYGDDASATRGDSSAPPLTAMPSQYGTSKGNVSGVTPPSSTLNPPRTTGTLG